MTFKGAFTAEEFRGYASSSPRCSFEGVFDKNFNVVSGNGVLMRGRDIYKGEFKDSAFVSGTKSTFIRDQKIGRNGGPVETVTVYYEEPYVDGKVLGDACVQGANLIDLRGTFDAKKNIIEGNGWYRTRESYSDVITSGSFKNGKLFDGTISAAGYVMTYEKGEMVPEKKVTISFGGTYRYTGTHNGNGNPLNGRGEIVKQNRHGQNILWKGVWTNGKFDGEQSLLKSPRQQSRSQGVYGGSVDIGNIAMNLGSIFG